MGMKQRPPPNWGSGNGGERKLVLPPVSSVSLLLSE